MDSNQIELKSREILVLLQKHLMRGTNMLIAEKEREREREREREERDFYLSGLVKIHGKMSYQQTV
jgi:hypothetical protein